MNLVRIATRLTEASARARRPFRTVLRLANAAASSETPSPFARATLRWRKLSERQGNRMPVTHWHTNLSVYLSQRIDMHFTCQSVMVRARQPSASVVRFVALPVLSFGDVLARRGGAIAAAEFRFGTASAGPFGNREVAALPLWPLASRRDDRSADKRTAASARTVPQRQIDWFVDRLGSISLRQEGHRAVIVSWPQRMAMGVQSGAGPELLLRRMTAPDRLWPQRVAMDVRSGAGPGPSLRRMTAPDRLEPAPGTHNLLAGPTGAKGIGLGAGGVSLTLASHERSAPSTRAPRAAPLELVWREPVTQDNSHAPAATADRRDSTFGERVPGPATTDRSEHADEKVIAQAREAARHDLLSGPTVERLADDVMRRIEKRLRIERERRGL